MSLTEESSSVDKVQGLLKQKLGFEIILLNAKHLPVRGERPQKVSLFNTLVGY